MSADPARFIFDADRSAHHQVVAGLVMPKPFIRDCRGWILFGPQDIRSHKLFWHFALQKLPGQKLPRVRVGCRYFDLKQAWKHWGVPRKGRYQTRKNECAQAVAIIRLMLLQAQAYGLLSLYATPIKFDSTIVKPKRKRHA